MSSVFRQYVQMTKAMILLSYIIQPWPPQDFGTIVDTLTFTYADQGIQLEALMLYTKAIFGNNYILNANFTPKVSASMSSYYYN
jgi:hypothetical protein